MGGGHSWFLLAVSHMASMGKSHPKLTFFSLLLISTNSGPTSSLGLLLVGGDGQKSMVYSRILPQN